MKEETFKPGLYIVSTPLGNRFDITLRALKVLADVDLIACEDTRVTSKLLSLHNILTPSLAYHDFNGEKVRPLLLKRLLQDEKIALVSDAGTPLISDPGYKLVQACIERNISVFPIPGPSAPIAGLVASGLPADKFYFGGFLPDRSSARRETLKELITLKATLVFFEAPHRLLDSLRDIQFVLKNRVAVIARELTKKFEEVRRGTLEELIGYYQQNGSPKGELLVLISPPSAQQSYIEEEEMKKALQNALQTLSVKDAAAMVATSSGHPRREIYTLALKLSKGNA